MRARTGILVFVAVFIAVLVLIDRVQSGYEKENHRWYGECLREPSCKLTPRQHRNYRMEGGR